jgi:hypothetical protein
MRSKFMLEKDFNIKSVVELFDGNGYRVVDVIENFPDRRNPVHSIRAAVCARGIKKLPLLREVVDFITARGLFVFRAVEYYGKKKFPLTVMLEISTVYPTFEASPAHDHGQ